MLSLNYLILTQMSKRRKYHILLIDDNLQYCETLKKEASGKSIVITHFHNLEDGIIALKESKKYKAVILDGRCVLDKQQKPETGKSSFVFHAIQELRDLFFEQDRLLPFCVNAENPDDFIENLDGITQVYKKTEQHDDMFSFLLKMIYNLPETKIRLQHKEVFEFLMKYGDETDEDLLEDVILNIEKSDASSIVSNLSILRRIEEKIFDIICIQYLGKSLNFFDNMRGSRTKSIISNLQQSKSLPVHLLYLSKNIYSTCSKYGNHNLKNKLDGELPGKYLVLSFLNALLELITKTNKLIQN